MTIPADSVVPNDAAQPTEATLYEPSDAQRRFGVHARNMQRLRDRYGEDLAGMHAAELLALQALIHEQLHATTDEQLVQSGPSHPAASANGSEVPTDERLSPGDISRIAEENHRRFYHVQCRLALLMQGWFETAEARGATLAHPGKRPFKNAKDFIARLNGIDMQEVERRLRIATAASTKPGASKMRAPKIQRAMALGQIDPASANYMIDRLRSIRAATKRAGATDSQADQLAATKEGEFLAKALHAGPEEVRKFADRVKRSTNRRFTQPGTRLTRKQRQYEEGLRFISPLGDDHVRLDWVMTKWQYRNVLERLRQQINNLRSEISRLHEEIPPDGTRKSGAARITPADADFEIPQLYDDRTPAQRWSHFLLDILETGLVLTTTTSGRAQDEVNQRSTVTSDIADDNAVHPDDVTPSGIVIPGLGKLVNVAPHVMVALQFTDLAGTFLAFDSDDQRVQTEIAALITGKKPFPELYDYDRMDMDWAILRRMSCDASIIPMVLNTKGEPLDVGRAQRTFPLSVRRAVILRDGGCAYPGCQMPHIYSDIHHVRHWQHGGETSLDNAVMLCRFHHTVIHESEILVRLNDDRFPEFLLYPTTTEAAWVRNLMHRG